MIRIVKKPEEKRYSIFAILSFICGIMGFFGATWLIAIILGFIALRDMRRNEELKGRVMARWGIILGIVWFIFIFLILLAWFMRLPIIGIGSL